jgi:hypothetical protein
MKAYARMLITAAAGTLLAGYSAHSLAAGGSGMYAQMAPTDAYLMERTQEIALARSAAPESISRDATILVLGRHGYETAVTGGNGFVCMVDRGWLGPLDWPERWNPKIRGANCLNPLAAKTVVPLDRIRTEMFLAGKGTDDVIA